MDSGSPGCARAISGRGTGLTPGPGSMPSTGANHGGSLGAQKGCWRRQEAEEAPATACDNGELEEVAQMDQTKCRAGGEVDVR